MASSCEDASAFVVDVWTNAFDTASRATEGLFCSTGTVLERASLSACPPVSPQEEKWLASRRGSGRANALPAPLSARVVASAPTPPTAAPA